MITLLLIAVAVCLEVSGQLLYKTGVNRIPDASGSLHGFGPLVSFVWSAVTNVYVMAGVAVYTLQLVVWWLVLSRVEVSYAFPLLSSSYVVLMLGSRMFLREHVSVTRWLGAVTIMFGVYLITRSAPLPR